MAPDVCKCARWDNAFRDGREAGGRPLFLKPNGDPQQTGWTGYDCSVPICVQVHMGSEATLSNEGIAYFRSMRCFFVRHLSGRWNTRTTESVVLSFAAAKPYPDIRNIRQRKLAANHGKT